MTTRIRQALVFTAALILAPASFSQVLSPKGYGAIRFGDSLAHVESILGQKAQPEKRNAACDYVHFHEYPRVEFMVERGIVTRADAGEYVENSAEVREGMAIEAVQKKYPTVKIEVRRNGTVGNNLILSAPNKKSALLFEATEGEVTRVRAGLYPAVSYTGRCK